MGYDEEAGITKAMTSAKHNACKTGAFPRALCQPVVFIFMIWAAVASPSVGAAELKPVDLGLLLKGARAQIGVTLSYNPAYQKIAFPGGDVKPETGVCTDVIVRAYRNAGLDLQLLVHEDMRRSFRSYPRLWGLRSPDPNIDHRRVPNLEVFFKRHGKTLPISKSPADYKPGNIVTWKLPSGRDHIGIVSREEKDGRPLLVHNIGFGTRADDILFAFRITGHYRYALD